MPLGIVKDGTLEFPRKSAFTVETLSYDCLPPFISNRMEAKIVSALVKRVKEMKLSLHVYLGPISCYITYHTALLFAQKINFR